MSYTQVIILGGLLFWLMTAWAIIDIARKDFGGIEKKGAWILFAALVPFVGVVAYLIFGYRKGIPKSKQPVIDENETKPAHDPS